MNRISENALRQIITDDDKANILIAEAEDLAKSLVKLRLTTSQIRALFNEVRQIQGMWEAERSATNEEKKNGKKGSALRRLILLKPKMAYRAQKERGKAVIDLVDVLNPAVDLVVQEKDSEKAFANFQRFVEFFEAILAYHKSYGGN